jgi:hypothetical protein
VRRMRPLLPQAGALAALFKPAQPDPAPSPAARDPVLVPGPLRASALPPSSALQSRLHSEEPHSATLQTSALQSLAPASPFPPSPRFTPLHPATPTPQPHDTTASLSLPTQPPAPSTTHTAHVCEPAGEAREQAGEASTQPPPPAIDALQQTWPGPAAHADASRSDHSDGIVP